MNPIVVTDRAGLIESLLQRRGSNFVSGEFETIPKMNVKRRDNGEANPFIKGKGAGAVVLIRKLTTIDNGAAGHIHAAKMQRRMDEAYAKAKARFDAEGGEEPKPHVFEPGQRAFGHRLEGTPLVEYVKSPEDRRVYLELHVEAGKMRSKYVWASIPEVPKDDWGLEIPKSEIEPFLPAETESRAERQAGEAGLGEDFRDTSVVCYTIRGERPCSVRQLAINGEVIILTEGDLAPTSGAMATV